MVVRGDLGNVVARAEGGVEWTAAFADLGPAGFPMLWALTPYGDAVFNQRQVPLLLSELDRLPAAFFRPTAGMRSEHLTPNHE